MTGTVVVLSENCTKFINGLTRSVKLNPPTKKGPQGGKGVFARGRW